MKIDKQNDHVCYNDQEHIYWNKDTDVKYISVTTLIGKYEQPYDKEFWSFYKAIERLITADQFKTQKKMLLETKRVNVQHFCDLFELTNEQILEMQQTVLNEWDVTNKESTERGTRIHAEIENSFYKTPKCDLKKYGLQGEFNCQKGNYKLLDEKGVYPEYLIYFETQDKILNIAGQIDLLIKDGNDIYIYDWKTNKKLDSKSYYDGKSKKYVSMKYPLLKIMDCNLMHYTMQLSTYAYMLQRMNPDFNIKKLCIVHYDHSGNVTDYELEYKKQEVELMLKDYKKTLIKEIQEKRRQKIVY